MGEKGDIAPDDLPRSPSGRVPQWVVDEAAGRPPAPTGWRTEGDWHEQRDTWAKPKRPDEKNGQASRLGVPTISRPRSRILSAQTDNAPRTVT